MLATEVQPELSHSVSSLDTHTSLHLFERRRHSVRDILKCLHVTYDTSANNPDNENKLKYVGSGTWSKRRGKSGELIVDVDVGCYCDHDCCGHLCGLQYTLSLMDEYVVVLVKQSMNV